MEVIKTNKVPAAIGSYSQAIKSGNTVYFSGQIPLDPETMILVSGNFKDEVTRVFENIKLLAEVCGGSIDQIVKMTVYLIELSNMPILNEVMTHYFTRQFPARTTIAVSELPKGASVEIEAVMVLLPLSPSSTKSVWKKGDSRLE